MLFSENYLLDNPEWKEDIIPEIMDGKNVADFIDPDILEKLEALEREEEKLQAEGFYDSEEDMVIYLFQSRQSKLTPFGSLTLTTNVKLKKPESPTTKKSSLNHPRKACVIAPLSPAPPLSELFPNSHQVSNEPDWIQVGLKNAQRCSPRFKARNGRDREKKRKLTWMWTKVMMMMMMMGNMRVNAWTWMEKKPHGIRG